MFVLGIALGGILTSLIVIYLTHIPNSGSEEKNIPPKGSRPNPIKSKPNKMAYGGVVRPKSVTDGMFPKPPNFLSAREYVAEEFIEKMAEDNPLKQFMTNPTKYNYLKLKQYKEEQPLNKEPFPQEHVYHSRSMTNKELIESQEDLLGELLEKLKKDNPSKVYMITTKEAMGHLNKISITATERKKEEPKMKIYHTETQEDYDALMVELEKEGVTWAFAGDKPTASNLWDIHGNETCIKKEGNKITYATCSYFNAYKIIKYKANDTVNNPSHYNTGGIETLDYIKAKVKDYPSYAVGNIMKYITRYEHKNGIEDLKKAQFYLNDLIEWMEGEK